MGEVAVVCVSTGAASTTLHWILQVEEVKEVEDVVDVKEVEDVGCGEGKDIPADGPQGG